MPEWSNDEELFSLMCAELYTPVVGDILDQLGRFHQFLPPAIHPMEDTMTLAGRAMPVLQIDVFGAQDEPFGKMTHALDDLQRNEVYIATGGTMRSANWGGIMTAAATSRGAAGAVVNGYHRDTPQVLARSFPAFSRGRFAQDSAPRTKVVDWRCPIEVEGTWVHPGDVVFGDLDGVVIVPHEMVDEVITKALEKARTENTVLQEIDKGMSATEAFARYGVL